MTIENKNIENSQPETFDTMTSVEDVLFHEKEKPFIVQLEAFEKMHEQPFEVTPWIEKETLILRRLNELVQIMRVNSTWITKLDETGVTQVTNWNDWHKVPIATRSDLQTLYTTTKQGLVIPWEAQHDPAGHQLIASGGSSGEPIITIYRTPELRDIGKRAGNFWRRNVLEVEENERAIILNLFDNMNGWASNELVQTILTGIPNANVIPAGIITLSKVADFLLEQGVTDIAGLPSNFSHLMDLLKDGFERKTYPKVQRITFGGEFMDPIIQDRLKQVFPNSRLISVYSSTQADHLAVQTVGETNVLRITDDINFIEIVDDNGQPVPPGTVGRILVTRLLGNGDQALRLDLQDKGCIELPHPQDPNQARKLRLLGRVGDYLRVSTWDIKAADLLKTSHQALQQINNLPEILARQIVVDENGVHLTLATPNVRAVQQLDHQIQFKIMHQAIMSAVGFFEDPHDWPPSIQLNIQFVDPRDLIHTQAGKIHPFVNLRGDSVRG